MKSEKSVETPAKNYVESLNDQELNLLHSKFSNNDQAEASDFLSQTPEMDNWLKTAKGPYELFDMLDIVKDLVKKEVKKRF